MTPRTYACVGHTRANLHEKLCVLQTFSHAEIRVSMAAILASLDQLRYSGLWPRILRLMLTILDFRVISAHNICGFAISSFQIQSVK